MYIVLGGILTVHFADKYIKANDINENYGDGYQNVQDKQMPILHKKSESVKDKLKYLLSKKGRS